MAATPVLPLAERPLFGGALRCLLPADMVDFR